jgi:hypothetical protein
MRRYVVAFAALTAIAGVLAACGGEGSEQSHVTSIDPADFQAEVDNPFFPLSSLGPQVYEGEEPDPDTGDMIGTRVESTVLPETDTVAGIEVTVVEEKDFEGDELVESTLDYYAQNKDGSVYYMGERVDEYDGGQVVGHGGQWLAGEGDNQPGVFMPALPAVGDEFEQEMAPGIAEDTSTVVALEETVTTPAGTFDGCIKTEDFDPLEGVTEFKYYRRGVGLVREEPPTGYLDLISY